MPRRSPLLATSLASLLAAAAGCTLDPAGALPPGGEGGGATTTTTGPGPGSTGSTTTTSTGSTSTGDGGGTTGSTGGDGGTGGAGDGGAGGAGGSGGAGPLDEWLTRVTGPDDQVVRDLAFDPTDGSIYVVGFAKGDAATVDGSGTTSDADGEDAFVAKLDADGEPLWMQLLGGPGNDAANAVAVSAEGRVFVAGDASGADGDGDLFAPGLETPPASPWGWLVEIDPGEGTPIEGIPFGPIDTADPIDLAVTTETAVAIATCTSGCGGSGRDVVVATLELGTDVRAAELLRDDGEQRAGAIAAIPGENAVVVTGRFAGNLDARVGAEGGCAPLVNLGNEDVFVAAYDLTPGARVCQWAQALSGTGTDRSDGVWVDADGSAYVAAQFSTAPAPISLEIGPHAVKVGALGVAWATPLEPGESSGEARAITGDGTSVVVGGRKAAVSDGYVARLATLDGVVSGERVFVGGGRTWSVTTDGTLWLAGGNVSGTTDFGGTIGPVTTQGTDGFALRFLAP